MRRQAENAARERVTEERWRRENPEQSAAVDRQERLVMRVADDFVRLSQEDKANAHIYLAGVHDTGRIVYIIRRNLCQDVAELLEAHAKREMDLGAFGRALRLWADAERERVPRTPIAMPVFTPEHRLYGPLGEDWIR